MATINPTVNAIPSADGQVTAYRADGVSGGTGRVVYYVNGMNTTANVHRDTALALSAITRTEVWGIYNKKGQMTNPTVQKALQVLSPALGSLNRAIDSNDFAADVRQCVWDWLATLLNYEPEVREPEALDYIVPGRLAYRGIQSLRGAVTAGTRLALRRLLSEQERDQLAKAIVSHNPCTVALIDVLKPVVSQRVHVVCHSQGNLIGSNALGAVRFIKDRSSLPAIVYALASPAPHWPRGHHGSEIHASRRSRDLAVAAGELPRQRRGQGLLSPGRSGSSRGEPVLQGRQIHQRPPRPSAGIVTV